MSVRPAYDAVVLAGGASRRMGGVDKCALVVGGRTLLDHVVAGLAAREVVVVGPWRPIVRAVRWVREDPPRGGPVAGLAAGLAVIEQVSTAGPVVVLAGDAPYGAAAVPRLLDALPGHEGALLVDSHGHAQPLVAAYDRGALRRALDTVGNPAGVPLRQVVDLLDDVHVPAHGVEALDCDDPAALCAIRAEWEARRGA